MGEVTLYERRSQDLDGMAEGLRMALLVGGDSGRHTIGMPPHVAAELVRVIENRHRVRVVYRDVIPIWAVGFSCACLASPLVTDAALFLAAVLR